MNFQDLHELLRVELLRRIDAGTLTGTRLAREAGFRQAHISNFLNRKRALSLEGLDRVLAAQNLTIDQILPLELHAASSSPAPDAGDALPVVSASSAMDDAVVLTSSIVETVQVNISRLKENRARTSPKYTHWQRFVAIRADAEQAAAMDPMIAPEAIVVIDRHYNSLAPYRTQQRNVYAVRGGTGLALRFVEFDGGRLILRPLAMAMPIHLLAIGLHETPADYLVGRVCLVISEL